MPVKRERPLSPHLQVYKPQITSILSITHRATGIALTLGLGLFAWWVIALATGYEAFTCVQSFVGSIPGKIVLVGWLWALFFHSCTGIRHLFWDAGKGFSIEATYRSGYAALAASILLTVATCFAAFAVRGYFDGQ
jgi:succinate dehydrogenase / fumarate reductase cytochrome b subunit